MLYALSILGLIGDVIAIWLALHAQRHERKNSLYLAQILGEVHEAVTNRKE